MGIRGLTGFIDKNPELLHRHELCNTTVVIDGNNFYHYLYHACHVPANFGGDYDIYRANVVSTLQNLRECNITPYVVLDGAYTVDSRKLQTSLSRAESRIKLIDAISNGHKGQALPALAYETFVQVMVDLNIPHCMCQFEADSEIATLANQLKCPVISNDSDFYIFDLAFGFLPLDYMDFRPVNQQNEEGKSSRTFLHCYKYHVDDLISSFDGLSRTTLPIFATLLGNDFIEASSFSSFYARVKVPKLVSKKFSLPPNMTKVIGVLHWLNTQADERGIEYIKTQLLSYIPPNKRNKVEDLYNKAVQGYSDVDSFEGFDLIRMFQGEMDLAVKSNDHFCSYNGTHFPPWFLKAACKGELTCHILNSVILHRVILLTQVESLPLHSSYNASSALRETLYAILYKDDCNSATDAQLAKADGADEKGHEDETDIKSSKVIIEKASERRAVVEEYTRVGKQLKKTIVELPKISEIIAIPSLSELTSLSLEDKKGVLFKAFGQDATAVAKLPDGLKIFALCVMKWVQSCEPKVTFIQLDSLIMCMIFLTSLRILKKTCKKQSEGGDCVFDIDSVCSTSSQADLKTYTTSLQKWHKIAPTFNRSKSFDTEFCHSFAQLQAILLDACHLNRLLQQPFPNPKPAELINGTLLYNMGIDLSTRPNPQHYISLMFGENGSLHSLKVCYNSLRDFFVEEMSLKGFLAASLCSKKKRKKNKGKGAKSKVPEDIDSDSEQEKELKVNASEEELSEYATNNKFSALMLCD